MQQSTAKTSCKIPESTECANRSGKCREWSQQDVTREASYVFPEGKTEKHGWTCLPLLCIALLPVQCVESIWLLELISIQIIPCACGCIAQSVPKF